MCHLHRTEGEAVVRWRRWSGGGGDETRVNADASGNYGDRPPPANDDRFEAPGGGGGGLGDNDGMRMGDRNVVVLA